MGFLGNASVGTMVSVGELDFDPATQAELDAHAAGTASVHGITDTSKLAATNATNNFTVTQTFSGTVAHTGTSLGFYNAAAVARPSAYTQTYATASRTHANPAGTVVATTAATQTVPFGFTAAQADGLVASVNSLVADVANVKQVVNSVVDDLQTLGLLQ